ncbi:unnamed protein product [Bursaphelenchus okinawaensis]|uniref:Uncharacterized protein n=1 Tax=Bursaphelenchus okinawaensis TaxID=465554 RepID=A0A811KGK7_9BILA|nr:unnamed protein product [Bursaphelenchus okinawaensis]CAG9101861.1 unnamed protein product [Bursaphelenchus okinawaensis]
MLKSISLTFLLVTVVSGGIIPKDYFIDIQGELLCEGKTYTDEAIVVLYDWDPIEDDKLATTNVSKADEGKFSISGAESGFMKFDPYLYVVHNCSRADTTRIKVDLSQDGIYSKGEEKKITKVKLDLSTGKLVN